MELNRCFELVIRQGANRNPAALVRVTEHILQRCITGALADENSHNVMQWMALVAHIDPIACGCEKLLFLLLGVLSSVRPAYREELMKTLLDSQTPAIPPPSSRQSSSLIPSSMVAYFVANVKTPTTLEWRAIQRLAHHACCGPHTSPWFSIECRDWICQLIKSELEMILEAVQWSWDSGISVDQMCVIEMVLGCAFLLSKVFIQSLFVLIEYVVTDFACFVEWSRNCAH
jgi:hypothetical protein